MFDEIVALFDFDFSDFVSEIVDLFTTNNEISEGVYETQIANAPWSAFVPWSQIFAFVLLIVFIICIFKFMRAVLCRVF